MSTLQFKASWCTAIDRFAEIFPDKQLCLAASSSPLGADHEQMAEEIIEYGISKHPERFTIQTNQLHGRRDNSELSSFERIRKYKDRIHHGFQNLAGFKGSAERQGTIEMTVYNFVLAGAEYLEVWNEDGENAETCRKIDSLIEEARKLGAEKFKAKLMQEGKFRTAADDHYQPNQPGGRKG